MGAFSRTAVSAAENFGKSAAEMGWLRRFHDVAKSNKRQARMKQCPTNPRTGRYGLRLLAGTAFRAVLPNSNLLV
jgi:hypothetical protein